MKLSVSNIAWDMQNDEKMYTTLCDMGFAGVEIAPTRLMPESPYANLEKAAEWRRFFGERGLEIPSMQSIWFGRTEKLFGSREERQILLDYTKEAIRFAETIGCASLVFGCPRNRNLEPNMMAEDAEAFFAELGTYAKEHHTVLSMEANPAIYHTNYINTTREALELVRSVDSKGFRLNLDFGTIIANGEKVEELEDAVSLIQHVHISEPNLKPIEKRAEHCVLADLLRTHSYEGFVSIEMGKCENLEQIIKTMEYVKEVFA